MLTYQLQDRVFRLQGDADFTFPNRVRIEVKLGPAHLFGVGKSPGRMIVRGTGATSVFNANTGRGTVEPGAALEPLDVRIVMPNTRIDVRGDKLTYEAPCPDREAPGGMVQGLLYGLPPLLAVEFPEPVVVEWVTGSVGAVTFRLEHKEGVTRLKVVDTDMMQTMLGVALGKYFLITKPTNRRLLAGLHYYHVARRLLGVGYSQWEFMAEVILNLAKSLTVMFGDRTDAVRKHLSTGLGYARDEIERDFVPLLILRHHFDVGHPSLITLQPAQLTSLYHYLVDVEARFEKLFSTLFAKVESGTYVMRAVKLTSRRRRREVDAFVKAIEARQVD